MPSKDEEILEPLVEAEQELAVAEQLPEVFLVEPIIENLTPYQPGQMFSFVTPGGTGYAIVIEAIMGDQITLRNTVPGSASIQLGLEAAQEILESPARVR